MSEQSCPKCAKEVVVGSDQLNLRRFACGSSYRHLQAQALKFDQSDRCKLTVAERERDEARAELDQWVSRAVSVLPFLPDGTKCGDLQEAAKKFAADMAELSRYRQAEEIQMRRGWTTTKWMPHDERHGQWAALDEWDNEIIDGKTWPTPTTAILSAEAWMAEQEARAK